MRRMKLSNLIALPFALIADGLTLGEGGVTRRIFNDERCEREIEAMKVAAEIIKESKKP